MAAFLVGKDEEGRAGVGGGFGVGGLEVGDCGGEGWRDVLAEDDDAADFAGDD